MLSSSIHLDKDGSLALSFADENAKGDAGADLDDRFILGFHASSEDVWLLLLEKLTMVEANMLKSAMTMAAITAKVGQAPPDLSTASGRDFFLQQTILGGECNESMFIESYLKSVSSVSFQRHRPELLFRLGKLFELHEEKKEKKGTLRFRDFPALRKALEGPDFAGMRKPPVTAYTERPMIISSIEFAPAAWEENSNSAEDGDVIPANLQVFSLSECSNLQFHPHLARYSFSINDALMMATIEFKSQSLLIHRVLHGRHLAPVTTSVHIPQNRTFYTAGADRAVCAWLPDERYCGAGKSRLPSAATCAAFDTISQMLVCGATDGCVYLLPVMPKLASAVRKIKAHTDWCMSVAVLPELEQVATCGLDGTLKIWTCLFDLRTTKTSSGPPSSPARGHGGKPLKGDSSAASAVGRGLTHMVFSSSQKMLFAVEGGRNINCWNVFLSSPSDLLKLHEKPVVGTVSFQASQEFITADTNGRIAVWDMHRALTTQRLGGPESEFPCGTINSIAYDPHRGSIAALGAKISMFVPEQGTFSPLFELPVVRVHYGVVGRTLVVPTGNRIVVLDLVTATTRNVMTIGTEEIAASCLASREHILLGTTEGTIFYSPLTHWRPTTVARLDDSVVALFDLGPNSRAGAQGEENSRVLAVTRTGTISHMAFGPIGDNYAKAPPKHFRMLVVDLVNLIAFSKAQFIVFATMGPHLEAWDLAFTYQKTSERLPSDITAMTCIDEINGLIVATEDGYIRVYNAASVIPLVSVRPPSAASILPNKRPITCMTPPAPISSKKLIGGKRSGDALLRPPSGNVPKTTNLNGSLSDGPIRQLVFNSNTCTVAAVQATSVKCFSCERLVQGLQRSQHDAPFSLTNYFVLFPNSEVEAFRKVGQNGALIGDDHSDAEDNEDDFLPLDATMRSESLAMGTVRSLRGLIQRINAEDEHDEAFKNERTLAVDLSALTGEDRPLSFACQWGGRDQTIVVCEMDTSYVPQCVARLVDLRRWWMQETSATISNILNLDEQLLGTESDADANNGRRRSASFADGPSTPHRQMQHTAATAPVGSKGLASIAESFVILPNEIHVPLRRDEQLFEGMARQAVYSICDPFPRRGAVGMLEQSTWNHRTPLGIHTIDSLKWLAISVASALHRVHARGFVALFSLSSIRYVCPNYKLCLEAGLFRANSTNSKREGTAQKGQEGGGAFAHRIDSGYGSLGSTAVFSGTARSSGGTNPAVGAIYTNAQSGSSKALPSRHSPESRALDQARRQVPEAHYPPEGLVAIDPTVDMWLLGLALYRACSGKSYDHTTVTAAIRARKASDRDDHGGEEFEKERGEALSQMFDRHSQHIHPSIRHDALLMVMLRGLLEPDPSKRITSIDLLLAASQYGEGIRRVVKTVGEAEAVVVGATVLDEVTALEGNASNNAGKKGQNLKNNDTIVTFDQQLPSIAFAETPKRGSRAAAISVGGVHPAGSSKSLTETTNTLFPSSRLNSGIASMKSGEITLLQFAPPAHLRLPCVPNPVQLGTARRALAEVEYDDLAVRKVGIEEDLRRERQPSVYESASVIEGRNSRSLMTGTTLTLLRNNSGFCKPSNESLASGPISFHPVLKRGQFTFAAFIDSLQLFLIAEFDRSVGASGCAYISLRRNLAASSFAQALGEYYRRKVTAAESSSSTAFTQFRRYDPGPDRASPYATLVVAIYPPNNGVQCLGGVESSDVEAAVTKRAGAGAVGVANKKDIRTIENERRLVDRAFEDSGGTSDSYSGNSSDRCSESGTPRRKAKHGAGKVLTERERKLRIQRKAERLERKTQELAKDEALQALKASLDNDDDFFAFQKHHKYKPERMCPFFTESQAAAEAMGIVSTVPPPDLFYMKGWHRERPMARLREGKTADPHAYQPRTRSLPSTNSNHPLTSTSTTASSSGAGRNYLPPLASPVAMNMNSRRDHNERLRKPISVRLGGDDLLCVTRGSSRKGKSQ